MPRVSTALTPPAFSSNSRPGPSTISWSGRCGGGPRPSCAPGYSANTFIDIHPIVQAIVDATGKSKEEALEIVRAQYAKFGINGKNAIITATVTVEAGDGVDEITEEALEYLGEGFTLAYNEIPELRKRFEAAVSGYSGGDIINISAFWEMAYGAMLHRAAYADGNDELKQAYEGKTSWYNLLTNTRATWQLNDAVSDDSLAPPSERLWHRVGWLIDSIDQASLIFGAAKLSVTGMMRMPSGAGRSTLGVKRSFLSNQNGSSQMLIDFVNKVGSKAGLTRAKNFDWNHIFERHVVGGKTAGQRGPNISLFPASWRPGDIKSTVRNAWKNRAPYRTKKGCKSSKQIGADGQVRQKFRGVDPNTGVEVEFWLNLEKKLVESAYPVNL